MTEDKTYKRRRRSAATPIGVGLGLAVGAAFGVAMGNLAMGMGFGLAIGAGLGMTLGAIRKSPASQDDRNSGVFPDGDSDISGVDGGGD